MNVAVLDPVSYSAKPVKPTWPSEQASRPSAAAGFSATPSGSATVVSRHARLGQPFRDQAPALRDVDIDRQPRWRAPRFAVRRDFDFRVEAKPIATVHPQGPPRAFVQRIPRVEHFARRLPAGRASMVVVERVRQTRAGTGSVRKGRLGGDFGLRAFHIPGHLISYQAHPPRRRCGGGRPAHPRSSVRSPRTTAPGDVVHADDHTVVTAASAPRCPDRQARSRRSRTRGTQTAPARPGTA